MLLLTGLLWLILLFLLPFPRFWITFDIFAFRSSLRLVLYSEFIFLLRLASRSETKGRELLYYAMYINILYSALPIIPDYYCRSFFGTKLVTRDWKAKSFWIIESIPKLGGHSLYLSRSLIIASLTWFAFVNSLDVIESCLRDS